MAEPKIKKEMSMGEILTKYPEASDVFQKHGLHCLGCAIASFETVEQGAAAHGMDLDKLLEDLNKVADKKKE
jgi:hybrid cluster-associated redox disulfide protein